MASGNKLKKYQEDVCENPCSMCRMLSKHHKATRFCVQCRHCLCEKCVSKHNNVHRDHTLLADQVSSIKNMPSEKCSKHVRNLELWCRTHDQVVCRLCLSSDHRSCKDVVSIPNEIEAILNPVEVEQVQHDLLKFKDAMSDIKKDKLKERTRLEKNRDSSLEALKIQRQRIEAILDKIEQKAVEQINLMCDDMDNKIKTCIKMIDSMQKNLEKSLQLIEKCLQNKSQLFVTLKKAEEQIAKACSVKDTTKKATSVGLHFTADPKITDFLSKSDTVFGNVYDLSTPLYLMTSKQEKDINTEDDTCASMIYDICQMADKSFILADLINKKLKHLDGGAYIVTDTLGLPDGPRSVCATGSYEAATCTSNMIYIVTVKPNLLLKRTVSCEHSCFGLSCSGGELYVSDNAKCVYVYSPDGKIVRKLGQTPLFEEAFTKIRQVYVSNSSDRVFVTDSKNGVICMDKKGKRIGQFKDVELQGSWGICTAGIGGLFVCGNDSNNVLQLTRTGEKLGIILDKGEGLRKPIAAYFDLKRKLLMVSKANSDTVIVCELS